MEEVFADAGVSDYTVAEYLTLETVKSYLSAFTTSPSSAPVSF